MCSAACSAPEIKEQIVGLAEVRESIPLTKFGNVAGCMVVDGYVKRNLPIRVLRDNVVIFEGELESLRRFKDDVERGARRHGVRHRRTQLQRRTRRRSDRVLRTSRGRPRPLSGRSGALRSHGGRDSSLGAQTSRRVEPSETA